MAPWLYKNLPWDPTKDLVAVAHVAYTPIVIATGSGSRFKSLADVVTAARAAPGTITYGSPGNGTTIHLAGDLFEKAAGVQLSHIPYKGSNPALLDAVLHPLGLMRAGGEADAGVWLPVEWREVTLHATGPAALVARMDVEAEGTQLAARLTVLDAAGGPVLTVGALRFALASGERAGRAAPVVHCVRWIAVEGPGELAAAPVIAAAELPRWLATAPAGLERVVVDATGDEDRLRAVVDEGGEDRLRADAVVGTTGDEGEGAAASRAVARVALAAALAWLAARPEATLLWVTRGATGPGVLRPAGAAAWGLWRSVRRERPELKLRLIDLDPAEAGEVLARLGVGDEQERAHRGGRVLVPRLERAAKAPTRRAAW